MKTTDLILIQQVCEHHQVEFAFIYRLQELGLVEVVVFEDCEYVSQNQLKDIEKMIRIHNELNINLEGIDVIFHLLQRIENLEQELLYAKNKLREFNIG
jgi:hypothetical protein